MCDVVCFLFVCVRIRLIVCCVGLCELSKCVCVMFASYCGHVCVSLFAFVVVLLAFVCVCDALACV